MFRPASPAHFLPLFGIALAGAAALPATVHAAGKPLLPRRTRKSRPQKQVRRARHRLVVRGHELHRRARHQPPAADVRWPRQGSR